MLSERDGSAAPRCPRCSSPRVVLGRPDQIAFTPSATKWLAFRNLVRVAPMSLTACSACGLLWSEVGVPELLEVLRKSGTKRAQAWLEGGAEEAL